MFQDLNPLGRETALLEIGIMLLGAALIGFLTAWVLRRGKAGGTPSPVADALSENKTIAMLRLDNARMEKELEQLRAQQGVASNPQAPVAADRQALQQAEAELSRLRAALDEAGARIAAMAAAEQALQEQRTQAEVAHAAAQQALSAQFAELRAQLTAAEAQQAKTLLQLEALQARAASAPVPGADANPDKEMQWLRREKEDLESDVRDLEQRIDRLERENSELRAQARDKSAAGPAIERLTKERDKLKADLDKLRRQAALPSTEVDFSHLGQPEPGHKDALTRITGIGPVVEAKLNALGICTYAQLGRLSEADMDRIDEVLQLFPGRVKRENWVEQARELGMSNGE